MALTAESPPSPLSEGPVILNVPKAQAESCTDPPQPSRGARNPSPQLGSRTVGGSAQDTGCLSAQLCPHCPWALPAEPAHATQGPGQRSPGRRNSMGPEPLPCERFPQGMRLSPPPASLSWLLFYRLAPLPFPSLTFSFPFLSLPHSCLQELQTILHSLEAEEGHRVTACCLFPVRKFSLETIGPTQGT